MGTSASDLTLLGGRLRARHVPSGKDRAVYQHRSAKAQDVLTCLRKLSEASSKLQASFKLIQSLIFLLS